MQSEQGKSFRRDEIWAAPDGRFVIGGLPETHYVLRATGYRKPATPGGERGAALASCTSLVHVPAKTELGTTLDLDVLTLKLHAAETRKPN